MTNNSTDVVTVAEQSRLHNSMALKCITAAVQSNSGDSVGPIRVGLTSGEMDLLREYEVTVIRTFQEEIMIGNVKLHRSARLVSVDGREVVPRLLEFQLLLFLVDNANRLVTIEEMREVWRVQGRWASDNTIKTTIKQLRNDLGWSGRDCLSPLRTIWGSSGYVLMVPNTT